MTKNRTTTYSVVVNKLRTIATFPKLREATRHVKTLGERIVVDGNTYPVNTVEIVKHTSTTISSFSPQRTVVFVADELDSDFTDIEA